MRIALPRLARASSAAPVVGADWGARRRGEIRGGHGWTGLVTIVLVAALALVALRVELIRMQYALAEAIKSEEALLGRERELTVSMRRLRHPGHLAERARSMGFGTPENVIQLEAPPARIATAGALAGVPRP